MRTKTCLIYVFFSLFCVQNLFAGVNPDGSFSHSFPIEIPPGRVGLQPKLALTYNSNSPNGMLGAGWSLQGLPMITRMNFGNGIKYNGADTFVGPEGRLIDVSGNGTIFHVENETWTKYRPLGSDFSTTLNPSNKCGDAACAWEVTDRNGIIYIYGSSNASIGAIDAAGYPINSGAIRVWALKSVTDLSQNSYTITYVTDAGQFYPRQVNYTLGSGASKSYAVSFFYDESGRPDKETSYAQSAYVRTNWRLSKIAVDYQSPCFLIFTCGDRVRGYAFGYETNSQISVSRLLTIQEIDANNLASLPISLTWERQEKPTFNQTIGSSSGTGNWDNISDAPLIADVNGDGRADLLRLSNNGFNYVMLGNGTGVFNTPVTSYSGTSWGALDGSPMIADVNGDGRPDVVRSALHGVNYVNLASTAADGTFNSYVATNSGTAWTAADGKPMVGDVNGDGKIDIVRAGDSGSIYVTFGLGNGYFSSTVIGGGSGRTWNSENEPATLTDVNGDNCADIVRPSINGYVYVLISNCSTGLFSPAISSYSGISWSIADGPAMFADINGDGFLDIIHSAMSGINYVMLNRGNGYFDQVINSYSGHAWQDNYPMIADVDGDGRPDIVRSSTSGDNHIMFGQGNGQFTQASSSYSGRNDWNNANEFPITGDVNGDGIDDIIRSSKSGYNFVMLANPAGKNVIKKFSTAPGSEITIAYKSQADSAIASKPICQTITLCANTDAGNMISSQGLSDHSPRYLTTQVTTVNNMDLDNVPGNDTQVLKYAYYNGRMTTGTIPERATLGFEKIMITDVNSGNYKIDTYRQDKPFHGRLSETASYLSGISTPVSKTTYPTQYEQYYCSENGCTINNPAAATPVNPQQIRPKLGLPNAGSATVTVNYQPGTSTIISTKEEEITEFDGNTPTFNAGNPSKIRQKVEGHDLQKTVFRHVQYINNLDSSLPRTIGLVYNEKLCLASSACTGTTNDPNFISESNTYYDSQGFTGIIGTRKLVTKKESFLSTDNNGAGVWVPETYLYDNLGNITQKIDAQGIKTTIAYDNDYKQYPTSVIKFHLGNSTKVTYDYDYRFGKKTLETTEDDGITTLSTLDASGFVSQVQTQNGATILSKKTFAHSPFGTTPIWTQECTFYGATFTNSSCRRKFTDALGRAYREEYPELVAGVEQQMAIERRYDSLGRETYVSQPKLASATFGTPNAPGEWSRKIYDTQNRLTGTISFDSKTTQIDYQSATAAPTDSVSCTITRAPDLTKKRSCDGIEGKPVRVEESYGTSQQTTVLYHYDSLNRLDSVTSPQSTVTTLNYLGRSQLQQSIIDPVAGTTSYEYYLTPGQASFAKLKKETRPASTAGTVTTVLEYDASFGRLSKTTKADSVTNYTYDETSLSYGKGRLTTQEHTVDGYTIKDRYSYNDRGETTNTTRRIWNPADQSCPDANVNTMPCLQTFGAVKDELGRIKTMTYPDGKVTAIEYMPGSTKNVYRIKHDGTTYATYSDYTFDIMAHVKKITYGNGLVHDYDYHPLNSVDPQRPPGLLKTIAMGKANEDPYLNLEITYDANLNIQRIDDHVIPAWTTEYHYDSLNRLKDAVLDVDGYVGTTYRYYKFDNQNAAESKGNLEIKADRQFTYPSGKTYPTSGQAWDSATQTASGPISTYTWSGNGNLLTKGPLTFTYDSNNMLKQAVEVDGSSATVGDTKFSYDQSGQRFLKKHTRGGVTIKTWYLGDGLEVREKYVGVTSGTPNGTYDSSQTTKYIYGIDNKKLASITGGVYTAALSITTDSMLALADSYSSSSVSGLASKAFYTFYGIYAHENFAKTTRICALLILLVILATWLVRTQRRSGEDGGSVMPLWIRGSALTLVLPVFTLVNCNWLQIPSGVTQGQVNTMISELYTGLPAGTVYYSHNHLGSGNLVTDAAGNELFRITYDEYGQIDLEKSGKFNPSTGLIEHDVDAAKILITAVKYTGQEYDPETGLYYYNARYYDPQLGVFTTADSEVPEFSDSQSYNRHMYVRGNPIMYTDPTGHFFWFVIAAIVIGAFVGGTKGQNPFTFDYKRNFDVAGAFKGGIVGAFTAVTGGLAAAAGISAAMSGAIGGAVGGFLNGHLNGQNWEQVLKGTFAGTFGGFAGGALGGLTNDLTSNLFGNTLAGAIGNGITVGAISGFTGGVVGAQFMCEFRCSANEVLASGLAGAGYGAVLGAVNETEGYFERKTAAQKSQKEWERFQELMKRTDKNIKDPESIMNTQAKKAITTGKKSPAQLRQLEQLRMQGEYFKNPSSGQLVPVRVQEKLNQMHQDAAIPKPVRGNTVCDDNETNMSMRPANACG